MLGQSTFLSQTHTLFGLENSLLLWAAAFCHFSPLKNGEVLWVLPFSHSLESPQLCKEKHWILKIEEFPCRLYWVVLSLLVAVMFLLQ